MDRLRAAPAGNFFDVITNGLRCLEVSVWLPGSDARTRLGDRPAYISRLQLQSAGGPSTMFAARTAKNLQGVIAIAMSEGWTNNVGNLKQLPAEARVGRRREIPHRHCIVGGFSAGGEIFGPI